MCYIQGDSETVILRKKLILKILGKSWEVHPKYPLKWQKNIQMLKMKDVPFNKV